MYTHTLSQGKILHKQGGFNIIEGIWKINIFQLDGQRVKRTGLAVFSFCLYCSMMNESVV